MVTQFEIKRKDLLHEKRNFNGNRFADYRVLTYDEFTVEFSISKSKILFISNCKNKKLFNFC